MSRFIYSTLVAAILTAGCTEEAPPPRMVEVVVDKVVLEPYQPKSRYVGRLQAQDDVTIEARITGYLSSREFTEGELVEEGDILYRIDPSEYEAALARAKADLAAAVANQANAVRNFKRGKDLLPKGAISEAEMDDLAVLYSVCLALQPQGALLATGCERAGFEQCVVRHHLGADKTALNVAVDGSAGLHGRSLGADGPGPALDGAFVIGHEGGVGDHAFEPPLGVLAGACDNAVRNGSLGDVAHKSI